MRLKYYLRGIGIGILFATLLMMISLYFGSGSISKRELSDEEIISRAAELGMVMGEDIASDDETVDENEVLASEETSQENEATSDETVENSDVDSDITGEMSEVLDTEEATEIEENETEEEVVTYVPFTVKSGEFSDTVSNNLYKAGLIDSSSEFNEYMNSIHVDNLIQAGTFYIKQGSSYDDIVALLVNKDIRTTTPPKED